MQSNIIKQTSLDRHYSNTVEWYQPDRYRDLLSLPKNVQLSAQGSGLSIAACSFGANAKVINMKKFDRILSFDPTTQKIEVEAGITLEKLFHFLFSHQLMLPVQPGYPHLTVGGCIASNVHGKNHFIDGTFARHVESIKLFHPAYGLLNLSKNENPEIFEITCGGFGLTGIIVSAVLHLEAIKGNCVEIQKFPVTNLHETFNQLFANRDHYDLLYSWNDLSNFRGNIGKGYIIAGKITETPVAPDIISNKKYINPNKMQFRPNLLNNMTLPYINKLYSFLSQIKKRDTISLYNTLFPWVQKGFYFNCLGNRGVIEPQILVPEQCIQNYTSEFEKLIRKYKQPFSIASFKLFRGTQKLLQFDGTGITFSIQIPNTRKTHQFLTEFDELNIQYKVITNLIKDSRIQLNIVKRQYPEFDQFRQKLLDFDSNRQFSNALSERLEL